MGYEVGNEAGALGQFASNEGYAEFIEAVDARADEMPYTMSLIEEGVSSDVAEVVKELRVLAAAGGDNATVAKELIALIDGEEVVLILGEGDSEGKSADEQASDDDLEWTSVAPALPTEMADGDIIVIEPGNPWRIEKRDGQFCVVKATTGKVMGKHKTLAEAKAQLAALHRNVRD